MRRGLVLLILTVVCAAGPASAAAPSFADEQLAGTLADDYWEPTTAADPHSGYVYQAVTGIGSHECAQREDACDLSATR